MQPQRYYYYGRLNAECVNVLVGRETRGGRVPPAARCTQHRHTKTRHTVGGRRAFDRFGMVGVDTRVQIARPEINAIDFWHRFEMIKF